VARPPPPARRRRRGARGPSLRATRARGRGGRPRRRRARALAREGAGAPRQACETTNRTDPRGHRHGERAHGGAAELEAVGARARRLAEIGGDLADVRALRALHADPHALRILLEVLHVDPLDPDLPRRGRDRLASPHASIRAAAVDLHGRCCRHGLEHLAGERRRSGRDGAGIGRAPGLLDLTLRVERRRDGAELHHRLVALVEPGQIGRKPRRPAGQDQQEPGGERVERAGVPELCAQHRAKRAKDAERARPGGLVDEQEAGQLGHPPAPRLRPRALPAGRRPRRR